MTITLVIKPEQTITASDVDATYGDTDKSVSASTDGNGEISYAVKAGSEDYISVAADGKLTIKKVPADGKAYVTVTAAETTTGGTGGNGYAAATKDVTVTVEPKTVGLTWGESSFTYDGKSHAPTATATGTVNGDEIAVTVSGGQTNASTTAYTATATDLTGEKASNYKLPDAVTHTFTIGQKAVTITAGSDTKVYDGVALTKNSSTNTDLAEGDKIDSVTVTGSQTVMGKIDNVPSAAKIVNAKGDDVTANYNITYAKGTLEVTQKAVTITAESDTKVYDGTALTKNAVTNSGLASGDRIASVTVTGSQTVKGKSDNVASAVKIVNAKGDDVTACYNVTYSKGSLEVTARPVTVTPQNNSKTYGESDPELTATVTDLVPGETLNYTLSRETGETANTYTISVNLGSNPNYSVTTGTATFTIHKAELPDLKVTLESWTYGDEPNTPVVEGNVENGDVSFTYREAGLKALPAGDGFSAATPTDMGEYEVKATVAETANYNGSEAIGKFTISPKSIEGGTVKLVSDKLEFTGQEQKVEIKEVKTKDGMTVDTYTVSGVATATDCNTYTLTVEGEGNFTGEATTTWKIFNPETSNSETDSETGLTVTGEVNAAPDAPSTTADVDAEFAKSLMNGTETSDVDVYLQVGNADDNVSPADKAKVEGAVDNMTNSGVGMYLDMGLYKKEGDQAAVAQATSAPVTVTMTVPAGMQSAAQAGYSRSFSVMAVVDGVLTPVSGVSYDAKTGQLTFQASKFNTPTQSVTYALVYTDTAKGGNGEFINLGGGSAASSTMSSFTMTTDLTGINKVTVDGKTVDPQYYTVSGGNVTLSPDYIKTLRSGTHILQAENATHVSTAKFTVKSALTADGGMGIYVSLLGLSAMLAAALIASRKRRQYCR